MTMSGKDKKEHAKGFRTLLVGFLGVFIASLCCLPLVGSALGTFGGLGLIIGLATYRLPLTLLGVGVFLTGVFQYRRSRKRDSCEN